MKRISTAVAVVLMLLLSFAQVYGLQTGLLPVPKAQFVDSNGRPISGGKLYTCKTGTTCGPSTTTNLKSTYTDSTGGSTNTNPVILDSAGRANVWLSGYYKMSLYTSAGVLVWSIDNISSSSSSTWGVDASQYASLDDAVVAIGSTSIALTVSSPISVVNNTTVPSNIQLIVYKGGVITIPSGKTLTINGPFEGSDGCFSGNGTVTGLKESYPEWFGAVGDGVADDQAAYQKAANAVINTDGILKDDPLKTYYIGSQLSLRYVRNFDLKGKIIVGFTGSPGVVIGDDSAHAHSTKSYIHSVRNAGGTVPSDPLIRIIGAKNMNIHIGICEYVQNYANADTAADKSSAYNTITFDYVQKHEILSEGTDTSGWINENTFYGGRIKYITVNGVGYNHNNNKWIRPSLEGATVLFNYGMSNYIEDARFEGTSTIQFDAGTYGNVITQQWAASTVKTLTISPTVTDNGYANVVTHSKIPYMERLPVLTIAANTINIFSNSSDKTGLSNIQAGLKDLMIVGSSTITYNNPTNLIPVTTGTYIRFNSDASSWRPRIYLYDTSGVPITGADPSYASVIGAAWNTGGYYVPSSNVSNVYCQITSPLVGFIRVYLGSGNSTANTWFTYANFDVWQKKKEGTTASLIEVAYFNQNGQSKTPSAAASPTTGFAQIGQMVTKTDGSVIYICSFSLDTTVSEEVAASETADISVTDLTGVTAGDVVGILLDDGTTYWDTVADVTGGDLTLSGAGPASVASSGNRIVFNRWATK